MKQALLSFFSFLFLFSCAFLDTPLTDEAVVKYIKAYKGLREYGIRQGDNPTLGQEGFVQIESIVKKAGFSGYPEFVRVNAKIGRVMSVLQSEAYIGTMENFMSDDYAEWKRILDDPDIPEENKKEVRETLEKARQEFAKNRKYADPVLNLARKGVDKETLAIVKRHEKELLEAYTGLKDVSF